MNHQLWNAVGARVIAAAFVVAGLTACGERLSDVSTSEPKPFAASPSAQVIGQAPAEPAAPEASGTPPPVNSRGEVAKSVDSTAMPLPGQANDHSNLAPGASQKAQDREVLRSPAAAANANNGEKANQ